jgi:D-alanyl-lipoteichoic acid acyltransferase DltB (MBOAT superfamily)
MALPLAISFFTFQQIAYLVDSFRGETKEYNFINYTIFVTFFPQLIAGPIVHHKEMMGQFISEKNKILNWENIYAGLIIFSIGLFKKVFVADTFEGWATAGFDHADSLNLIEAWVASISYTLQIYYDFSGYTDMAMGSARFFNIRLPRNFNSPYKAVSIQDFWRRWHMTLSRWLRDYLFIPLGGSRCGESKTLRNLMITFFLGGLWHGAEWTFVAWGAMHGAASVVHRLWSGAGFKMPRALAWLVTFLFVNVTWVFFRASDFASAIKVLKGMVDVRSLSDSLTGSGNMLGISHLMAGGEFLDVLPWLGIFTGVALIAKNSDELIQTLRPSYRWALAALILLLMGMPDVQQPSEFLYFNF